MNNKKDKKTIINTSANEKGTTVPETPAPDTEAAGINPTETTADAAASETIVFNETNASHESNASCEVPAPDETTAATASAPKSPDNSVSDAENGSRNTKILAEMKAKLAESEKKLSEVNALLAEQDKKLAEAADLSDRYLRMMAEYDNYRKRAVKERESLYADAYSDALKELLGVLDNLERAAKFGDGAGAETNPEFGSKVLEGLKITLNSFYDTLKRMGVEEIEAEGKPFDPEAHNAVMHVEDENFGENTVTAVLQKGYRRGDKIIRYAVVTVAN